jgi:hypothetical protein
MACASQHIIEAVHGSRYNAAVDFLRVAHARPVIRIDVHPAVGATRRCPGIGDAGTGDLAAEKESVSRSGIATPLFAYTADASAYDAVLWLRRQCDHVRCSLPGSPRSSPQSGAVETHAEIG